MAVHAGAAAVEQDRPTDASPDSAHAPPYLRHDHAGRQSGLAGRPDRGPPRALITLDRHLADAVKDLVTVAPHSWSLEQVSLSNDIWERPIEMVGKREIGERETDAHFQAPHVMPPSDGDEECLTLT
jgi:hypothetical protein